MSEAREGEKHRDLALKFLNESNTELSDKIDKRLVESVYDLFANESLDSQAYRRKLEIIIKEYE